MNQNRQYADAFKNALEQQPVIKTFTKFLWLPKTIQGQTKWLVTASWEEEMKEEINTQLMEMEFSDIIEFVWKPTKWV